VARLASGLVFATVVLAGSASPAFGRAGATDAVPELERRLHDPSAYVQLEAASALLAKRAPRKAVARLGQLLVARDVPRDARLRAANLLAEHPRDAVPAIRPLASVALMPHEWLIERMPSDGREERRSAAAGAIRRIGAPALPALRPYLRKRPREEQEVEQLLLSVRLVCSLRRAARDAFPDLAAVLAVPHSEIRSEVAGCLATIGSPRELVAQKVLPLLADRDQEVVGSAALAAVTLGPAAAPALPRLRKLLDNPNGTVRVAAVDAIGNLGAAARPARAELEDGLTDGNEELRPAAALALVKTRLDPKGGLQFLLDQLAWKGPTDESPEPPPLDGIVRIGRLAAYPEGKVAMRALVAALGNDRTDAAVARALAGFGAKAADMALVPLTKLVERGSYPTSKEASGALATFGAELLPSVPTLVLAVARGGDRSGQACAALVGSARRSKVVDRAVRAECAKTTGAAQRLCAAMLAELDAPPPVEFEDDE
jgi:HEAT repeat protein